MSSGPICCGRLMEPELARPLVHPPPSKDSRSHCQLHLLDWTQTDPWVAVVEGSRQVEGKMDGPLSVAGPESEGGFQGN